MVTRPALYVWGWWRDCFLMRCLEAPLPCRSLNNFNIRSRYLYKMGRGSSKGRSRHLFQIFEETFFTQGS